MDYRGVSREGWLPPAARRPPRPDLAQSGAQVPGPRRAPPDLAQSRAQVPGQGSHLKLASTAKKEKNIVIGILINIPSNEGWGLGRRPTPGVPEGSSELKSA